MTTKNQVREQKLAEYLDILKRTYDLLDYDKVNVGTGYMSVARAIECRPWQMINLKTLMGDLGILKAEMNYNPMVNGVTKMGRQGVWRLMVPYETAALRIKEWDKKGEPWEYEQRPGYEVKAPVRNKKKLAPFVDEAIASARLSERETVHTMKPSKVALARSDREETRAIAGPEPTSPFSFLATIRKDEPRALIEAARQYMNRQDGVEKQYRNLVGLGLAVDHELFIKSIALPYDPVLDAVSQVVPLVTTLDSTVERLANQLADVRERTKDYSQLKTNYERLQKRLAERVAEKVANGE
jgi:hypothetical protein